MIENPQKLMQAGISSQCVQPECDPDGPWLQTIEDRLNQGILELELALTRKQALKKSLPESVLKMKWHEFSSVVSSTSVSGLY